MCVCLLKIKCLIYSCWSCSELRAITGRVISPLWSAVCFIFSAKQRAITMCKHVGVSVHCVHSASAISPTNDTSSTVISSLSSTASNNASQALDNNRNCDNQSHSYFLLAIERCCYWTVYYRCYKAFLPQRVRRWDIFLFLLSHESQLSSSYS